MKIQSVLALAAMAGLASSASAQFFTDASVHATVSLSWVEDPAFPNNGNGVLDPGEHALILASLSFTDQYQRISFAPAVGAFASGIITGLGTMYTNITSASADPTGVYNNGLSLGAGPNANLTGTSGYGVRGGWRLGGNAANGTPATNGIINIGPGQLPTDPTGTNVTNPITNLDRLGWAPASYAQRTVTFSVAPAAGAGAQAIGLYVDLDGTTDGTQAGYSQGTLGGVIYIPLSQVTLGSVNIPIAPAPASLALLGLGGLIAGRRRR
jgi:hypothetical protein